MSFLSDWDDILDSLEAQRKKYGGSSIGGSAGLVAGGKGFRFPDEAAADRIIASFEERAKSMQARQQLILDATQRLGERFSDDDASDGYREKAMASLRALDELNTSAMKYAMNYVKKIEAVKKKKNVEDGDAATDADKIKRTFS
jgi:hypothetical protein